MSDEAALLGLQRLDTTADQLRHRLAHLPERTTVQSLQEVADRVEATAGAVEGELAEQRRTQKRLEDEIASNEAKEAEVGRRLSAGTVAREVTALSHELDNLRARRGHLEDDVLAVMEDVEGLSGRAAEAAAERDRVRADFTAAVAAMAEAEVAVEADLARTLGERAAVAEGLPPAALASYERLRKALGGVAVAELVNGTCSGCNLKLPASELDRIRHAGPDAALTCEECGRILVHG